MDRETAIKILREQHDKALFSVRTALETLIPELRVSDDERIRNWLIMKLETNYKCSSWAKKAIAWLEKQKEPFESGRGLYYYDGENTTYCGYPATEDNPYDFAMSQQEEQKKVNEIPMPNSTELIEMWDAEKDMLQEKDFRNDTWRIAQNAFMDGFAKGTCVKFEKQKEQTVDKQWEELQSEFRSINDAFESGKKEVISHPEKYNLQKEQKPTLNWRTIEQATTKRTDEGDCVTTERMLIKGLIDDEDYRIIDKDVMVNKNLLCIPVSELNSKEQKPVEKQDYSGLTDFERAIHRGFLCAGVENVPVEIIKETAKECLAQVKPVEWSEEDEERFQRIISLLDPGDGERAIMFLGYNAFIERRKMIDFLKSLKNRGNFPKSNTNSPSEWTEKETRVLKGIVGIIAHGQSYGVSKDDMLSFLMKLGPNSKRNFTKEDIGILEVLLAYYNQFRVKSSWKPSNEQMEALNAISCHGELTYTNQGQILIDLYNDLKKLCS